MKTKFQDLFGIVARKEPTFASCKWMRVLAVLSLLIGWTIVGPMAVRVDARPHREPPEGGAAKQKTKRNPRASGPAITPSAPGVAVGQSITFSSSTPVTWTLSGAGTLSSQTSTSVVYTAPASMPPLQSSFGCPVMPNDTVFHTRVDSLPVNSNNNTWFTGSSTLGISFDVSWGTSYADSSTPTRVLKSYYGSISKTYPNPQFNDLKRENGNYVGRTGFYSNPDHHMVIIQRSTCGFSETYDDYLNGQTETCQDGVNTGCNVRSGIQYPWSNYSVPDSPPTDAAGLPIFPFTATLAEVKSGVINHALRFTTALGYIGGSANLGTPLLWPAILSNGCPPANCPNAPTIGARVRLKSGFNISTYSPTAQVILTALQRYGMILADIGTSNAISVGGDLSYDQATFLAMNEIRTSGIGFNSNNFEFVDESSLEVSPTSYQVNPANGFVTPPNQVLLTATPAAGAATTLPIAVQGVAIGTRYGPDVLMQAGNYSWQIPFWVNPATSSQTVSWSLTSGVGSVTAAGVYTPPATVTGSATAVLHAVAAADSAATADLFFTIIPGGTVGIDTGATTNSSVSGIPWIGNIMTEGGSVRFDDSYPGWKGSSPLLAQYNTGEYAQTDQSQTIIVPNGNYDISYLLGLNYLCTNCGSIVGYYGIGQYNYGPYLLESNNQTVARYYDIQPGVGYIAGTVSPLVTVPAKVTSNVLYASLRPIANDVVPTYAPYYPQNPPASNSNKYTVLSGLLLRSDQGSPRWSIDTQQQATISSGQTLLPFYVVDWFTGVNDPTWSVVSGPSGAVMNGSTLSFHSTSYFNNQPIVVQASDGTYSATATILTTGGTQTPLGIVASSAAPADHFSYKRSITISHSNVGTTDLANFPVLVSINDPTFALSANGGRLKNANGYDVVFSSDSAGANRLSYERESYDSVAGAWLGDVKIPTLSHTADTTIYVLYGNPATNTDQSTPQAVWDSNYTGVFHMASLTAATTSDSTSLANNALRNQSVTASQNGKIGQGANFGGSGSSFHFEFPSAILNAASGTVSAWLNSNQATAAGQNFAAAVQADTGKAFHFMQWSTYYGGSVFGWNGGTDYTFTLPSSNLSLPVNSWAHLVYTWDQSSHSQKVYLNGTAVSSITTPFTPYTPVNNFWLGTDPNNQAYAFGGIMDEVRFSKVARSSAWVAAEYANQSSPIAFAVLGTEGPN